MKELINKIGVDKILHFCATFTIVYIVAVFVTIFTKDIATCAGFGWAISWLSGVAKEIIDGNGDSKDLLADLFGSLTGALSLAYIMYCGYAGLN